MNRRTRLAVALAFALVFAWGCPLTLPVPLGTPEVPIAPALLGLWEHQDPAAEQAFTLAFTQTSETVYQVDLEEEVETKRFAAYVVRVGGIPFLNFTPSAAPDGGEAVHYGFARYEVTDDTLAIRLVDDRLFDEKPGTTEALRAKVEAHLEDDRLYDKPLRFRRIARADASLTRRLIAIEQRQRRVERALERIDQKLAAIHATLAEGAALHEHVHEHEGEPESQRAHQHEGEGN